MRPLAPRKFGHHTQSIVCTLDIYFTFRSSSPALTNILIPTVAFIATHWIIGRSAEIRWRLSAPTAKEDTATIYLVGGGKKQYQSWWWLYECFLAIELSLNNPFFCSQTFNNTQQTTPPTNVLRHWPSLLFWGVTHLLSLRSQMYRAERLAPSSSG